MAESWQKYVAEAFGVFAFVFIGAGAAIANGTSGGLGVFGVALAHGLAFVALFYATAYISGAHLNPAVTFSLWATGHMKTLDGVAYIVSQLVGGVMAMLFLKIIFAATPEALSLGGIGESIPTGLALFVEAILGFIFLYVYFSTVINQKDLRHAALALGAVVMGAILAGGALSGGMANPARVFGPALILNSWGSHFIYWF